MGGWMDGWTDGRMAGWMHVIVWATDHWTITKCNAYSYNTVYNSIQSTYHIYIYTYIYTVYTVYIYIHIYTVYIYIYIVYIYIYIYIYIYSIYIYVYIIFSTHIVYVCLSIIMTPIHLVLLALRSHPAHPFHVSGPWTSMDHGTTPDLIRTLEGMQDTGQEIQRHRYPWQLLRDAAAWHLGRHQWIPVDTIWHHVMRFWAFTVIFRICQDL